MKIDGSRELRMASLVVPEPVSFHLFLIPYRITSIPTVFHVMLPVFFLTLHLSCPGETATVTYKLHARTAERTGAAL